MTLIRDKSSPTKSIPRHCLNTRSNRPFNKGKWRQNQNEEYKTIILKLCFKHRPRRKQLSHYFLNAHYLSYIGQDKYCFTLLRLNIMMQCMVISSCTIHITDIKSQQYLQYAFR